MAFHGFVALQGRGLVALPAEVRRRLGLDTAGVQMEITEREDGVIELRPMLAVPADQAWFWTERWQQREREVDRWVAEGQVATSETTDDFIAALDALADQPAGEPTNR